MKALIRVLAVSLLLPLAGAALAAFDMARLAAAVQAGDEFMRRAEGSATSGQVPRRSDPGIATLLDTVFDAAALGPGPLPISDAAKVGELMTSGNRVGLAYLLAGTGRVDLAGADATVLTRSDENVVAFAPETGQFLDFQLALQRALAGSALDFLAGATPDVLERPNVKNGLARMRGGLAQTISGTLQCIALDGLPDSWRSDRLAALEALAEPAVRLVTPQDGAALRDLARDVAGRLGDPGLQARLTAYGERLVATAR